MTSETFFKAIGVAVFGFIVIVGISVLGAYPTKWVMNYLFSPSVLTALFGVAQLGFWKALALNFITSTLFKGTTTVKA